MLEPHREGAPGESGPIEISLVTAIRIPFTIPTDCHDTQRILPETR